MEEEFVPVRAENEQENKRKTWVIVCIVLLLLLLGGGGYYYYTNYYKKSDTPKETARPNLKDDFYDYANYLNPIEVGSQALETIQKNEATTGMAIEEDSNFKNDAYSIMLDLYDDRDEREKKGLDDLKPYFNEIDNANTMDKFSDVLVKVFYDLNVNSFLNVGISQNFYDNSKNVIFVAPIELESLNLYTMDTSYQSGLDFYANEKYDVYKQAFEKARIRYFKQYGYDEKKATDLSNQITDFAKKIQAKSKSLDDIQNNLVKNYKNISKSELKSLIHNMPIDKLLAKLNLSDYPDFAILDEGQIKALDEYYKEENLPLMKEILKLLILEKVASLYTSSDYEKIYTDVAAVVMGYGEGVMDYQTIVSYYENYRLRPELMGSILNTKYDEKYFPENEKQEIVELAKKIISHYKEVIKKTDWLDDSTREEALKKLDNMQINVGFTKHGDTDSTAVLVKKEDGGTLISNLVLLNQDQFNKLHKQIKEKYYGTMNQFQPNAFYDPNSNSINFISGFREMYRDAKSKYEMYGYAGTIIGHEISHAFDTTGSNFDENGNVKNWWTEDDYNDFENKKKRIIDYYSNYELLGVKINGELTVGENIADLASVKTLLSIMESENATNDDYKTFFEAYARLWNAERTKEQIELQVLTDPHSPHKIRINAVLSSMDKFYEVYDIKEGDKMYVAKEDRVGLW